MRAALTQLGYRWVARHLRLLAESLPGADGQIPLWAYPELADHCYELLAPAYSEFLRDQLAVDADVAARGLRVAPLPPMTRDAAANAAAAAAAADAKAKAAAAAPAAAARGGVQ